MTDFETYPIGYAASLRERIAELEAERLIVFKAGYDYGMDVDHPWLHREDAFNDWVANHQ